MGFVEREGKASTRSIRIDKALDEELVSEAERQSLSVSSLIERVLEDYLNHGRWVERQNALTVMAPTMMEFLEHLDEGALRAIGDKMGSSVPLQRALVRGASIDVEVARDLITRVLGGGDRWFNVSYHEHNRPYYYITNQLGGKWITFIEAYICALYRENLNIEVECIKVGDNLQVLI